MRIDEIQLTCFRNHLKTTIKGLSRVNIVVGPNGAGKTSILDAIGYALTGTCRGTDAGGKGADALACQLPSKNKAITSVLLKTDRGELLRALGQGPSSQAHVQIVRKLGLDERVLRVLAAPMNLLRLPAKKQEEVFFSLTGSSVTGEAIAVALAEQGIDVAGQGVDVDRLTSPEGRAAMLTHWKERRVELKRERDGLVYVAPEEKLPEPDEERRVDLDNQAIALREQVSQARGASGQAEGMAKHLDELLQREQGRLRDIEKREAQRPMAALSAREEAEIRGQITRRQEIEKGLADLGATLRAKRSAYSDLAAEAKRVEGLGNECDRCGQEVPKTHVQKRLKVIMADMEKFKKEGSGLQAQHDAMSRDAALIDTNALLAELSESERAKAAADNIKKERKQVEGQIADLQKRRKAVVIPKAQDTSKLEAEVEKLMAAADLLRRAQQEEERRVDIHSKRTGIEDSLEAIEKLLKAAGSGGVIQQLMAAGGTEKMLEAVVWAGQQLGVGAIGVNMGPWQITLNGRPIELASASEEFRVAAAFGMAFAMQAGASIVCLDGAEILFGEYRDMFQSLLFECGLEQVFVAATRDEVPESLEPIEGLAMYAVGKDTAGAAIVTPIPQKVGA